ncbi:MAG: MBOAT family O-acyltransferase [Elainellaceae cyanobacterium]
MVFNSFSFLLFFIVIIILYYGLKSWQYKKIVLLIGSYIFYSAFHPPFVLLLLISTVIDWNAGIWISKTSNRYLRVLFLCISLTTNLGMLSFFKYGNFFQENLLSILKIIGVEYQPLTWNILLPVGISYYTFQTLSYTIDIYRDECEPEPSLLNFALFVSFFPQLVAGPIVRARDFLVQTRDDQTSKFDSNQFFWGLHLLTVGLFGKIVLADRVFSPVANSVYENVKTADFLSSWIGTIAFSGQIYFDFSGYSTCAIGVALCLGFSLPDNFRFPYAALGFSDFWRRWHISLSTWLRDYLYISLGGSRKGNICTYRNIMITMLLGGLWHGASWNFVIWGGLHGIYLVIERFFRSLGLKFRTDITSLSIGAIVTYLAVCITWVFFRTPNFADAILLIRMMFSLNFNFEFLLSSWRPIATLLIMAGVIFYQILVRDMTYEDIWIKIGMAGRVILLSGMLFLIFSTRGEQNEFIYFQF